MTRLTRPNVSAGLLLFRRSSSGLELFIAHPGGPFWKDRDTGAWTIPKGIVEAGEDFLDAARREFEEETSIHPTGPFIPLGSIRQKAGKTIHIEDAALDLVVEKGYNLAFGARFLKRFIDEHIKLPISARWKDGTRFSVRAREGQIVVEPSSADVIAA